MRYTHRLMYAVIRSGEAERVAEGSACASNCWARRRDRVSFETVLLWTRHRPGHPRPARQGQGHRPGRGRGAGPKIRAMTYKAKSNSGDAGPPPALRDVESPPSLRLEGTPCRRPRVAVPPERQNSNAQRSVKTFSGTAVPAGSILVPARTPFTRHQRRPWQATTRFALTTVCEFGTARAASWSTSSRRSASVPPASTRRRDDARRTLPP